MKKYLLIIGILMCTNLIARKVPSSLYIEDSTIVEPNFDTNTTDPKGESIWKAFRYRKAIWSFSKITGEVSSIRLVTDYKTTHSNKKKLALLGAHAFESSAAQANGDYSAAFGDYTEANGHGSFAFGGYSIAQGDYSFAGGANTNVMTGSHFSFAYGENAIVSEERPFSFAYGQSVTSNASYSFVAGLGNVSGAMHNTVFGRYNYSNGIGTPKEWEQGDYLFEIGNGTSETERSNAVTVLKNGKVGIGITNPLSKLHIAGVPSLASQTTSDVLVLERPYNAGTAFGMSGSIKLGNGDGNVNGYGRMDFAVNSVQTMVAAQLPSTTVMSLLGNGNVGIGTNSPGPYKLAVEGTIGARKVKVTQVSPWADYVFDPSYKLMPLTDLEKFILTNKHLPEVPSATEVEKNGVDLGDTQTLLLKKIEELTLHLIEMNKKLESQQLEIIKLKAKSKNQIN